MTPEPMVLDRLSDEEAYLYAVLSDPSGLDQAELKRCRECLHWKSLSEFHFQSKTRRRRHPQCGSCRNSKIRAANRRPEARARRKERYDADAEARRAYSRRWYSEHGIKRAYGITRSQADERSSRRMVVVRSVGRLRNGCTWITTTQRCECAGCCAVRAIARSA